MSFVCKCFLKDFFALCFLCACSTSSAWLHCLRKFYFLLQECAVVCTRRLLNTRRGHDTVEGRTLHSIQWMRVEAKPQACEIEAVHKHT